MTLNKLILWVIGIVVTVAAYIPVMFMLAETPLHDGSELPSNFLLVLTLIISILLGIGVAKILKILTE